MRAEAEWKETSEELGTGGIFEADTQQDIEFALIQMKAETLDQINQALSRLDEGAYGYCLECGKEIPERRLRALPFAIRCKDCEEALDVAEERGLSDLALTTNGVLLAEQIDALRAGRDRGDGRGRLRAALGAVDDVGGGQTPAEYAVTRTLRGRLIPRED